MLTKNVRSSIRHGKIVAHGADNVVRMAKTASKTAGGKFHGEITRDADGNVDIVAEIKKHPDALWMRVKAIECDRENDNGDYFSREEIVKAYKSFEGVPVFTNHENSKVENAKGKVVSAEWDDRDGSVYCTMYVDRSAHPDLARAIEQGYVTDVSMGTQVDYSTCSICENLAHTAEQYCDHVKTMKGRTVSGKKVFEKNYGLKFIEISVVTDGACKDCTIREVIDPADFVGQAQALSRAANVVKDSIKTGALTKDGGIEEIKMLNEAMELLENVTRAMLDQRQFIDMEFMQKVAEVLSDLQHVTDELVDAGYSRMGSGGPGTAAAPDASMSVPPMPVPASGGMQEQGALGPNPVTTGPIGTTGVGAVTEPAAAGSSRNVITSAMAKKIKELHEAAQKIYEEAKQSPIGGDQVNRNDETVKKLAKVWNNPSVRSFRTEVAEGDIKIVIGGDEVIGLKGGTKIASLKVADLDPDVREMLKANPHECGQHLLDSLKSKTASAPERMEKEAEKAPTNAGEQWEQTMEAQLREQKTPLHPRQDKTRDRITEGQLQEDWKGYDFHKRKDEPRNEITEKQLINGDYAGYDQFEHQNKPRQETQESQLRNTEWKGNVTPGTSEMSWAAGVSDQKQQITEGQLEDWKGSDKRHLPTAITEKQLKEQREPLGRRIASVANADEGLKALSAGLSAIVRTAKATGAAPEEIVAAIGEMTSSPKNELAAVAAAKDLDSDKARQVRTAMMKRAKFHGNTRVASNGEICDYLLGSLSDENLDGMLGVQTLEVIASAKDGMKKIGDAILAGSFSEDMPVTISSPKDLLRKVLAEADQKDAGREPIEVILGSSEIKADPNDKAAFAAAAYEVATKIAESTKNIKVTDKVHVAKRDDGTYEVSLYGVRLAETKKEEPKTETKASSTDARKDARKKLVEAQMPAGGGMPAPGMEAGAPAAGGGTTMPAPAADAGAGMTPPVSALGEPAPAPGMEGMGEDEGMGGEAMPPGSICPVCGTDDVDLRDGEFHCHGCGAEGHFRIQIDIEEWPGTLEGDEGEGGGDEGMGDEGGMELPDVGLAQAFRVTPEMVKKANNKPVGSFCPHCGSGKVKLASKNGEAAGKCETCSGAYRVDMFVNANEGKNELWAQVAWKDKNVSKLIQAERKQGMPKMAAKASIIESALKAEGMTANFAKADLAGKAKIIADLHDKGVLANNEEPCKCGCKPGQCSCGKK